MIEPTPTPTANPLAGYPEHDVDPGATFVEFWSLECLPSCMLALALPCPGLGHGAWQADNHQERASGMQAGNAQHSG